MEFYYPLTLGVRRRRPVKREEMLPSRLSQYDAWREGMDWLDHDYDRSPEANVLQAIQKTPTSQDTGFWTILGEPGSGKSTLLAEWFRRWATSLSKPFLGMNVPILVRLRALKASAFTRPTAELAQILWNEGIESRALIPGAASPIYEKDHGCAFRPVWLLDGLDEVDPTYLDEALFERFKNLPGRVLLSCRTAVYESLRRRADPYKASNREYDILGLRPEEQIHFLAKIFPGDPARATAVARSVRENVQFRALAPNPLLLTLMAETARSSAPLREGDTLKLPATRGEFYKQAIASECHRKLKKAAVSFAADRDRFLTALARRMGLERIEVEFQVLHMVAGDARVDAPDPLIERLGKVGLLKLDRRRERASFLHLTFQEFFLAQALGEDAGVLRAVRDHWEDARFEEVLGLLISECVRKGESRQAEDAIRWLVAWGERTHTTSPHILWEKGRSPLRVALHLMQRSCAELHQVSGIQELLVEKSCLSYYRKIAVAGDSHAWAAVLPVLAKDAEPGVRREVAWNTSSPSELLPTLAKDTDDDVRRGVAWNPSSPSYLLPTLAKDADDDVRWGVAVNPSSPSELLAALAKDAKARVRRGVAGNPSSPSELLAALAKDADASVRWGVAENPSSPAGLLAALAKDADAIVRWKVAVNPSFPSELLAALAKNADGYVRGKVAENPSSPSDLLAALAKDANSSARRGVAGNPSSPSELLAALAKDADASVRWGVAENPSSPSKLLAALAKDADAIVRWKVAENPSSPSELLVALAKNADDYVHRGVAENPSSPSDLLAALVKHPYGEVRRRVASNPSALLEDL